VRPGGTAIAMGLATADARFSVPSNALVQGEKRIQGSLYGSANTPVDIPRILRLYEAGRLPLDRLLGPTYSLDAVNEAYDALVAGAVGRLTIFPNGNAARTADPA
jgi:Zn-dependent alcohol dehydrogenase